MADKVIKSEAEWREQLTPEQYEVCRNKGTERAFSGKYWDCKQDGIYRCACCSAELFASDTKYDSGTGWPSFFAPLAPDGVRHERDESHGTIRTEVVCAHCDAHLGHVFPDGPTPSGERYCMNSCALELDEKD